MMRMRPGAWLPAPVVGVSYTMIGILIKKHP